MSVSTKPKSLQQVLKSKGLTETELIEKKVLSRNLLNRWQSGAREPKLGVAIRFCREVGLPLKELANTIGLDTTGVPDDIPESLEALTPHQLLTLLASALGYSVVPAPDTPNDAEQEHRPIPSPQTDGRDTP
jgi:transcriptional regulator with XRE-family HTH domain